MNRVLGDLDGCAVYLDDVVVYSDSWEDHLFCIRSLFECLTDAQLLTWPNVILLVPQLFIFVMLWVRVRFARWMQR